MANAIQTDILTHWQDESGNGLRAEFTGRFLLPDGELTEDVSRITIPRDGFAKHRWHSAANCFLCVIGEDGTPTEYHRTVNPPTFDVTVGFQTPTVEPAPEPIAEPVAPIAEVPADAAPPAVPPLEVPAVAATEAITEPAPEAPTP